MGREQEFVAVGEFDRSMQRIERWFERIDARFDALDTKFGAKIDDHAERLAVLEAKTQKTNRKTISWSTAGAATVAMIFEGVRAYLLKP